MVAEDDHTKFGDVHSSGPYYLTLQVVRLPYKLMIVLMISSLVSSYLRTPRGQAG